MKLNKKKNTMNKEYYIGVDVGGTSIKIGIFDKNKKLLDKFSMDTVIRKTNNEKLFLNDIFDVIESYCDGNKLKLTKNKITGIGFAMPGPVVDNQLIHAVNINWKKKYDIVKATKKRFGQKVEVVVLNDGNAATLGENSYTLKNKYKCVCLITLGTAVGTGIIIDGKLIEGKTGIAGELSHIRVDYSKDAAMCACGNRGCIETLAGTKGLKNIYSRLLGKEKLADTVNAKMIIDKAKANDKIASEALDKSFDCISSLIAILMHVFEPEVVLIGGGMSNAGKFIIDLIEKHLKEKIFMTKTLPKIMIAKLKNDAGMYGVVSRL